ncbi:hypothetical protein BpHYR1_053403, partial [Brachionus plicatilis]
KPGTVTHSTLFIIIVFKQSTKLINGKLIFWNKDLKYPKLFQNISKSCCCKAEIYKRDFNRNKNDTNEWHAEVDDQFKTSFQFKDLKSIFLYKSIRSKINQSHSLLENENELSRSRNLDEMFRSSSSAKLSKRNKEPKNQVDWKI